MQGLMQDWPLLIHKIMDHAALYHSRREVVSHLPDCTLHSTGTAVGDQIEIALEPREAGTA